MTHRLTELLDERLSLRGLLPTGSAVESGGERGLKIVHLSWADYGGAGIAAYRLHRGLVDIGVDSTMLVLQKSRNDPTVKVLPTNYRGTVTGALEQSNAGMVLIQRCARRWMSLAERYPERSPHAMLFTDTLAETRLRYVREVREADIVNLHWVAGTVDYGSMPRDLAEKPLVWTLHDMNPFTGGCHYAGTCTRYCSSCGRCPNLTSTEIRDPSRHIHRRKKEAYRGLGIHVVTPSVWLGECTAASSLLGRFPRSVIPYGLPTDIFRPMDPTMLRSGHRLTPEHFLVLFGAGGTDDDRKGFRYLVEAVKKLDVARFGHRLALGIFGQMGEDPFSDTPFPVLRFGIVAEQERLAAIYSAADVFIIPTTEDNLPNTVLESLACGTPVVGFQTGGVPDMVEHGRSGYLVPQRDVDGLVKGIEWAFDLGDSRREVSDYCRSVALKRYHPAVQAHAYRDLYHELAARKARALELLAEGEAAAKEGDTDEASAKLRDARERFPHVAQIHNDLGVLSAGTTGYREAQTSFVRALEVNPDDRTALLNLGDAATHTGTRELFVAHARSYLDDHPDDDEVRGQLLTALAARCRSRANEWTERLRGDSSSAPAISVLLVVPPGGGGAAATLACLAKQETAERTEVVVLDASRSLEEGADRGPGASPNHLRLVCMKPPRPCNRYEALNVGIGRSTGAYLLCLTAGDTLAPGALKALAAALDAESEAAVVYGDTVLTNAPAGTADSDRRGGENLLLHEVSYHALVGLYSVGPHPMWRRQIHEKVDWFDENLAEGADQDLWLKVARHHRLRHLALTTGTMFLDEHTRRLLPPSPPAQFPAIRARHRFLPQPGAAEHETDGAGSDLIASIGKVSLFAREIATLVERGRLADALELYDRDRERFSFTEEITRLDELVGRIRVSDTGKGHAPGSAS